MKRIFIIFLLSAVCFLPSLFTGCGKDTGRPVDLPPLYPVKISITQNNTPLSGATVTLLGKTPSKYGAASGTTDASGTAVLRTYGYNGAPAGEYAVLVQKIGTEGAREEKTPEGKSMFVGGQSYAYVDAAFASGDSTTLSIRVTAKGVAESFDVGSPVRTFLGDVP